MDINLDVTYKEDVNNYSVENEDKNLDDQTLNYDIKEEKVVTLTDGNSVKQKLELEDY